MTEDEKEEILWELEYDFAVEYVDTYLKLHPNEDSMQFWFQTDVGKNAFCENTGYKYKVRLSFHDTGGHEITKLVENKL
jgi:hypothetical protein